MQLTKGFVLSLLKSSTDRFSVEPEEEILVHIWGVRNLEKKNNEDEGGEALLNIMLYDGEFKMLHVVSGLTMDRGPKICLGKSSVDCCRGCVIRIKRYDFSFHENWSNWALRLLEVERRGILTVPGNIQDYPSLPFKIYTKREIELPPELLEKSSDSSKQQEESGEIPPQPVVDDKQGRDDLPSQSSFYPTNTIDVKITKKDKGEAVDDDQVDDMGTLRVQAVAKKIMKSIDNAEKFIASLGGEEKDNDIIASSSSSSQPPPPPQPPKALTSSASSCSSSTPSSSSSFRARGVGKKRESQAVSLKSESSDKRRKMKRNYCRIIDIHPHYRGIIKARVSWVYKTRVSENNRTVTSKRICICDQSAEILCIMFNQNINNDIRAGQFIKLFGLQKIQDKNAQFNWTKHDYEIVLSQDEILNVYDVDSDLESDEDNESRESGAFPVAFFNFVKLDQINTSRHKKLIDVLGVVKKFDDKLETLTAEDLEVAKKKNQQVKADIIVFDDTEHLIKITVWTDSIIFFLGIKENDLLAIKNAQVTVYKERVSLTTHYSSQIFVNAFSDRRFRTLKQWLEDKSPSEQDVVKFTYLSPW